MVDGPPTVSVMMKAVMMGEFPQSKGKADTQLSSGRQNESQMRTVAVGSVKQFWFTASQEDKFSFRLRLYSGHTQQGGGSVSVRSVASCRVGFLELQTNQKSL